MQRFSLVTAMACLLAASCAAAMQAQDSATPVTQPGGNAGMQVSVTVNNTPKLTATVTMKNTSTHPIGVGRFMSFAVARTDVSPPQVVVSSPADEMQPHFRRLMQPGDSGTQTLTLSQKPLPAGKYELTITYPPDMLPQPVRKAFEVSATTQPH